MKNDDRYTASSSLLCTCFFLCRFFAIRRSEFIGKKTFVVVAVVIYFYAHAAYKVDQIILKTTVFLTEFMNECRKIH